MRVHFGALTLFLSLLLAAAPTVEAQQEGVLTGRVTDAETGRPIQTAQISVLGSEGLGGVTNAEGVYRIQVPAGNYAIAVELIGYASAREESVRVRAGETTTVDFALESRAAVLNPIVVTAQRRQEKALESPSTVVTVGKERVTERVAITPVDNVKGLPGVDIAQTGLTQSNIVTRGFNNIFSGSLLVITDNRYARVPSLRFNAWNMIPSNQLDVERMEVLLGPAAALYGPNAASGVLHIITQSPLDDQGTAISLAGGERETFQGQFRTAFKMSENTGLKVSGQFFRGRDWIHLDSAEVRARRTALAAGADPDTLKIGARDFDTNRWSGEARFDWRPGDDSEFIVNAGLNSVGSSVELTGGGPGQADDWRYSYLQARFRTGRFFAQAFVNKSDAGDTFLLETGNPIVDESELWVGQLQHGFSLGERQDFVYGIDAQFTRPKTGGTITGRNEEDDDINEVGGYVQSTTDLHEKLDLITALRVDDHSEIEDPVVSPRAALVFSPTEEQSFRFTYNRSFSTPTTNNLFLDLVFARIPITQGVGYDVRLRGVPTGGFTFDDSCPGGIENLCMFSPFAPGTRLPANGLPLWNGIVQSLFPAPIAGALLDPGAAPNDPALNSILRRFNQTERSFDVDQDGPEAISDLTETIHNTFEFGYKGILGDRLLVTGDVYFETIKDFIGPLKVETPNVFFDPGSVQAFVLSRLGGQVSPQQVQAIVEGLASIPLGTVTFDGVDSSDLILTYRNFGDVDYWGADLALQLLATDKLSFTGTYAFVSEDCFDFNDDGLCFGAQDVALNAPQNKGSIGARWEDKLRGLTLDARARFQEAFPMNSGAFVGDVDGYTVVDANVQYRLPNFPGASVGLTAYNLLDNDHREFVGAPEIGRLLFFRAMYEF